jgi:hypothetical protein
MESVEEHGSVWRHAETVDRILRCSPACSAFSSSMLSIFVVSSATRARASSSIDERVRVLLILAVPFRSTLFAAASRARICVVSGTASDAS